MRSVYVLFVIQSFTHALNLNKFRGLTVYFILSKNGILDEGEEGDVRIFLVIPEANQPHKNSIIRGLHLQLRASRFPIWNLIPTSICLRLFKQPSPSFGVFLALYKTIRSHAKTQCSRCKVVILFDHNNNKSATHLNR